MTYQSPGLVRRSAFSATTGSTSSGSGASGASAWVAAAGSSGAASGATASSAKAVAAATAICGLASAVTSCKAMSTDSPTGRSPSEVVTVSGSFLYVRSWRPSKSSAEHHQHELGQAQVPHADQRHHEHQERQHHRGVGHHLLAVGPDDLAQLGDNLLEVVVDKDNRVARRSFRFAGLLGLLGFFARLGLCGALGQLDRTGRGLVIALVGLASHPGPLAGGTLRPRHYSRAAAALVFGFVAVGCVGNVMFVPPRLPLRSFISCVGGYFSSVHHRTYYSSAGATGLEPATCGFGDRCSAS